jgi:hypothetical protein
MGLPDAARERETETHPPHRARDRGPQAARERPKTLSAPVRGSRGFVPLVEELVPLPDPVRCCEQLRGLPYRLFLDSAARSSRLGRYSFLTADPVAIVRSKGARVECDGAPIAGGDALDALRTRLAPFAASRLPELPPFQGGAAGYLAYDWGRVHERLPAPRYEDLGVADVVLGIYDWVLAWDHEASRAWLISTGLLEPSPEARARRAAERAGLVLDRLRATGTPPASPPPSPDARGPGREGGAHAPTYSVGSRALDPRLELRSSFTVCRDRCWRYFWSTISSASGGPSCGGCATPRSRSTP